MNNKLIIYLVVAVLVIGGGYLVYQDKVENAPSVSAEGIGTIKVQPDEVNIHLNIEARNSSAESAKNQLGVISSSLVKQLTDLGLNSSDIQTEQFSVYPDYDYSGGSQKMRGYVASQQVTVKVKDFSKVGSIIDKSIDSGSLVSWIDFALSQEKQNLYKKNSLEAASLDGKEKATASAKGLGKKLGSLVSVDTVEYSYYPYEFYRSMDTVGSSESAKSAGVNLQPKELEITSRVMVKYKISAW